MPVVDVCLATSVIKLFRHTTQFLNWMNRTWHSFYTVQEWTELKSIVVIAGSAALGSAGLPYAEPKYSKGRSRFAEKSQGID